ncbi:MAG: SPFH domain-containing protein, partial [Candidatus Hydrogenedentes bacterium]|nr:SPFH domain-containing protein [Candidatus Hydrogenedentota bacterium]
MQNLVNEVLQAVIGNHFRDKLQSMPAITFIETRQQVQEEAFEHVKKYVEQYQVETKGVYIQDVIFPKELVNVLTEREIANQEVETFKKQRAAQDVRIDMEQAKGQADMQAELAKSDVGVRIKQNNARARTAEADGEAAYIEKTGMAQGASVKAIGLARAEGYRAQVEALGQSSTTLVNMVSALAESKTPYIPNILVAGGNSNGALEGLAAALMQFLSKDGGRSEKTPTAPTPPRTGA